MHGSYCVRRSRATARARLLLERSQLGGAHVLLAQQALLALRLAPEGEHVLRREQRARARRARREATECASRKLRVDRRSKHEERDAQHSVCTAPRHHCDTRTRLSWGAKHGNGALHLRGPDIAEMCSVASGVARET
jgi:hypothetical protein